MAKRCPAAEAEDAKRVQVTLDPDIAQKARIIAAALGMTLPDWVNNRLRPVADVELPEVMAELGFTKPKEK